MLDPVRSIHRARQSLEAGDLRDSWRQVDFVKSSFPEIAGAASDLQRDVLEKSSEQDRWGRVSIATWPHDAKAAVCLTFDDRLTSHVDVVYPDLDSFRFPGTFFVIRNNPPLESTGKWYHGWCALAASHHEIGNHTATHPKGLPELPDARVEEELQQCDEFIRQLGQAAVTSFAYPFGTHGEVNGSLRRAVRQRFAIARATHRTEVGPNAATPIQMDRLQSLSVTPRCSLQRIQTHLDRAIATRGWLILTFHKVATGLGASGVDRDLWMGCLNSLATRAKDCWVCTASQAASYVYTRRSAMVQCHQVSEDALFISLESDELPVPALVRPALSVTIDVPKNWESARVIDDRGSYSDHPIDYYRIRTNWHADGRLYRVTKLS